MVSLDEIVYRVSMIRSYGKCFQSLIIKKDTELQMLNEEFEWGIRTKLSLYYRDKLYSSVCIDTLKTRNELVDIVTRLLGESYFDMKRTASGVPQLDPDDEIYQFWEWVMKNDGGCLVYMNEDGRGEKILKMCVDSGYTSEFCDAFLSDDYFIKAEVFSEGILFDVAEILDYKNPMDVWKYRPAGLRDEW